MNSAFPLTQLCKNTQQYLSTLPKDINRMIFIYVYGKDYEFHLDIINIRILDKDEMPVVSPRLKKYVFNKKIHSFSKQIDAAKRLYNISFKNLDMDNRIKLYVVAIYIALRIQIRNYEINAYVTLALMNIIIDKSKELCPYNNNYSKYFNSMARYYRSHSIFQIYTATDQYHRRM